jgi:O26-antigen biosynthesis N-acetyl-L-fucosamine transferase
MHFILLTDYFLPIIKSGSIIVSDLSGELVRLGHKVTIVTFVNIQDEECKISNNNNLQIIRIRSRSRAYGLIGRLLAEQRYSQKIIKTLGNLKMDSYDGIICYSPSIFYGAAIKWLKTKNNLRAYLIIRDIFPKWALDAGLIKKGFFYNYLKNVEREFYKNVDIIGIEAESDIEYFKNYIDAKFPTLEVLNNWSSNKVANIISQKKPLLDLSKVNIVYGGNIGSPQNLLSLIKMLDHSILEDKAVLTIFGSGNQFKNIKETIKVEKLHNIFLIPLVDRNEFNWILSHADIGLVCLNHKLLSNNYPLKMINYMQLGLPILASVNKDNEIFDLINQNNIGFVSEANNKKEFNQNLNTMVTSIDIRKKQGQNGKRLFNEKFTSEVAAAQICSHFID